ncbi:hypothetical protein BYT27DRAFT_7227445 [Phlegmacium glaucopus]|nr:hypothetical protein BYT27DRAFT_7227445 [Phlegmacium glaucopus]
MGRCGNGASLEDISRCSKGSVENYTNQCFTAIELTSAEKEVEKKWMDEHLGFRGKWREGWVMYDGTIVVLYKKPGLNIGNVPSNLCIADYSHGMTGSAHDAAAFEHTTAAKYPNWFFADDEFAWADSAYGVNSRTIPVHKQPASLDPANALFNKIVAHLRVHSEHCMGALKGRFQCLRGLHLTINSKREHNMACRWITIAMIMAKLKKRRIMVKFMNH